jgi:hypothetical protein
LNEIAPPRQLHRSRASELFDKKIARDLGGGNVAAQRETRMVAAPRG